MTSQYHWSLAGRVGGISNLLFIGFIATVFHTLPDLIVGQRWIVLPSGMKVSVATLQWLIGINLYIGFFWRVLYLMTRDTVYNWMFGCYLFAIMEMFIVWDKPWFKFIGIPMTSNTLVFFGFAYAYIRNNWVRYVR